MRCILHQVAHGEILHKVRGMTRCGQGPLPLRGLVDGAHVEIPLRDALGHIGQGNGLEPDHGHGLEEHVLVRLSEHTPVKVPTGALQEHAVEVHSVLRISLQFAHIQDLRSAREELQRVDGYFRLARVQLQRRCHEALREEEARQPETLRRALYEPVHHELDAQDEVVHPRVQGLHARIRYLGPITRDLLHQERVVHALQIRGH
mmetsp:Transcript_112909/g.231051  ORF Transcript_112909/g.231051 Transcript_112909/m.231051 type:complete len:204 (-) Transcript_112909:2194-2805(-)